MGDIAADKEAGTPRPPRPLISAPPSQIHSPSMTRSPLLSPNSIGPASGNRTPRVGTPRIRTPRFITPIGSPIRRALQLTRLDPQDAWLPITESRNGNAFYAAFHCLCSGIGIQALILPVAFTVLGWAWGVILLTLAFIWQMYTLYLLVQLHESTENGVRYSRYLQLTSVTFGEKLSKWLALFPIIYLSIGTCIAMVILAGSTSKILFQTLCQTTCGLDPLRMWEWYLVFTCVAVVLSQLPNLNSIAGISLIGAITAVGYCTLLWVLTVSKGRLPRVSYKPEQGPSHADKLFDVLNAIGIIAFAFRGHNLILEIQATMPSSEKHPSSVPMWRGVKFAYLIIAMCLFPLAIGGYWAFGQRIPENGGMLAAFFAFRRKDTARSIMALTCLFVIINSLCSFQIYAMPMFDEIESQFTKRRKKPCPWWLRAMLRTLFGFFVLFVAVAIPSAGSVGGLIGGLALPVTLAYPCFMWIKIKKPKKYGPVWFINWALGIFGMVLSVALIAGGIYVIMNKDTEFKFFKPE